MRIFLDTNVLASALATRGLCADVLRCTLSSHQLVTSPLVIEELKRVLTKKLQVPAHLAQNAEVFLRQDAILAYPGSRPSIEIKDASDLEILSSALAADADVFVTGDKELLAVKKLQGTRILSPREFWEQAQAGDE